ncbi:MAG: DNA translocase FtsK [Alphaproteobacteria bacterium MarineAlpha8_Bin1]|nr:MAG: DNA translocase FtsK [Alphaproteobacteria bacterium MarineAlpha8_Bin1]
MVPGIFLFAALSSYDKNDQTIFKFSSITGEINNFMGLFGSYVSGPMIQSLGAVSYLVPVALIIWAFRALFNYRLTWVALTSLPLSIIFLCVSFEYYLVEFTIFNGGVLGKGIKAYLLNFLIEFENSNLFFLVIPILSLIFLLLTLNIKYLELRLFVKRTFTLILNFFIFLSYIFRFSKKLQLIKLENKKTVRRFKTPKERLKKRSLTKNNSDYDFPSIELLELPEKIEGIDLENKKNAETNTNLLANVLSDFKISGEITDVKQGPIVTLFELTPAPGTLSSSVIRLAEDIARSMSAISTRISTIVGRDALGIEIPNKHRETVYLREILDSKFFRETNDKLPLALGKDIFGKPVIVDLAKMPHLLVAGTTGSGKSVGINAMLLSLLYVLPPDECKLILIDPKMLELSVYQDIPHLLTEVVTDPQKAVSALKWTVKEMESRYKMMQHLGVREIEAFNDKVKKLIDSGEVIFKEIQVGYDPETGKPIMEKKALDLETFPKIIVVVDELADLMITSGREIEGAIQRLSQMARAAGIHLIVATQRPSVDVITGTIKSNFPTRISYKVVNKINSRTIIEKEGAEQLLGQGDLLITMFGEERLIRVHGPFVKTEEVQSVVDHLKKQGEPEYLNSVTIEEEDSQNISLGLNEGGDELYNQAVAIVCREKKASTSFIQRHLQIGYNRAARIIERMESEGIVSPANHVGRREVLVGKDN